MKEYSVSPVAALFLLVQILFGCQQSPDTETPLTHEKIDSIPYLITQIQKCSRLYTTEYQIHKIVTFDDAINLKGSLFNQSYSFRLPFGDRKVAIPMDATLKAYIDFSQFAESSVELYGEKIIITLPTPRVVMTSSKIDQQNIREYVSLTRSRFTDQELTELEQQGREAILHSIPQIGIVEQARLSSAKLLIPLIKQMGFKEDNITIVFPDSFNPLNLNTLIDTNSIEK